MPFLVETLSAQNIEVKYDYRQQHLVFSLQVTISPGEYSDTCPYGFALDETGKHCSGNLKTNKNKT